MRANRHWRLWILLSLVIAASATAALAGPFGRDALRSVVAACRFSKTTLGISFPCTAVQLDRPGHDGYAIIRSPGFASEFLLTPLADYDGIESPELQSDAATDLWQAAWNTRDDVAKALGRPLVRTQVGLAVNASGTRTQDHFHIHIDCLRAGVGKALEADRSSISDRWRQIHPSLRGRTYWVRQVVSSDLAGVNIARLIAEAPPANDHPMAHVTLALAAATLGNGKDGFFLLANWQNASAEQLLDHNCHMN